MREDNTDAAKDLLETVVSDYAHTAEATEANQILDGLKLVETEELVVNRRLLTIQTCLILFFSQIGRYPTEKEGLEALVVNPGLQGWEPCLERDDALWLAEYEYVQQGDDEPRIVHKPTGKQSNW